MQMVTIRRPCGTPGMPLPSEGVHDLDGNLFHHSSLVSMMPPGVERLREYGIICETKAPFSKEEDALMERNWEEFRAEHNLAKMDIFSYAGFGGGRGRQHGEMAKICREHHLWPRLCRGLETRCAQTVRKRLLHILHVRAFPDRPFTEEDDVQLQQLVKRFPMAAICELLSRSFSTVTNRAFYLQRRQMFSQSERRKLWNTVCAVTECVTQDVKNAVTQSVTHAPDGWNIPEPNEVVWLEVSGTMSRCRKTLQKEWNVMVAEMESLRDEGLLTFEDALNKVAPECPWISAADLSEFVALFVEEVPALDTLRIGRIHLKKITDKMKRFGITGFRTGRLSEFQFCRRRLGRMLSALRRNLLRPASLRLSLSTQLCLLSRCLRSLPGAEKNQRFVLRRSHVIKQIEKQMTSEDPEWKLSGKLRRYIERDKD